MSMAYIVIRILQLSHILESVQFMQTTGDGNVPIQGVTIYACWKSFEVPLYKIIKPLHLTLMPPNLFEII